MGTGDKHINTGKYVLTAFGMALQVNLTFILWPSSNHDLKTSNICGWLVWIFFAEQRNPKRNHQKCLLSTQGGNSFSLCLDTCIILQFCPRERMLSLAHCLKIQEGEKAFNILRMSLVDCGQSWKQTMAITSSGPLICRSLKFIFCCCVNSWKRHNPVIRVYSLYSKSPCSQILTFSPVFRFSLFHTRVSVWSEGDP